MEQQKVVEIPQKEDTIDWDVKLLDHPQSKYSPEQKIAVMTYYFVYGNLEKAATYADVPYDIVKDWHTRSAWWETEYQKIVAAKQHELDSTFTNVLHDCMSMLKDRLVEGDSVFNKAGDIVKLPIKAKELAIIGGVVFDKRQLLRGNATSISTRTQSLEDLESKFKEISEKLTNKSK